MLKVVAAAATLAATAMEARRGLSPAEDGLYRRVNDAPDSLAPFVWLPMQAGALAAPFVLAAATYWRTRSIELAASFAGAGFAAWLGAKAVKKAMNATGGTKPGRRMREASRSVKRTPSHAMTATAWPRSVSAATKRMCPPQRGLRRASMAKEHGIAGAQHWATARRGVAAGQAR